MICEGDLFYAKSRNGNSCEVR